MKIKNWYLYTSWARYNLAYLSLLLGIILLFATLPPEHGDWGKLTLSILGAVMFFGAVWHYYRVLTGKTPRDNSILPCPACNGTGSIWNPDQ